MFNTHGHIKELKVFRRMKTFFKETKNNHNPGDNDKSEVIKLEGSDIGPSGRPGIKSPFAPLY